MLNLNLLLPAGYAISGILLLLPVAGIILLWRRKRARPKLLATAITAFFASQTVYLLFAYVVQSLISGWLFMTSSLLTVLVVLGLVSGLLEEGFRLLVLSRVSGSAGNPVAFGVSWGSVQAALSAFLFIMLSAQFFQIAATGTENLVSLFNQTGQYTPEQLQLIEDDLAQLDTVPIYMPFLTVAEQFLYIGLQVSFTLVMIHYIRKGDRNLLVFALLAHAVVDSVNFALSFYSSAVALASYAALSIAVGWAALRMANTDIEQLRKKYI